MVENNIQLDGKMLLSKINSRINALQQLISMDISEAPELKIKVKELASLKIDIESGLFNVKIWD